MSVKISRKRLREVIEESGGVITEVARAFNVSRQTIYNWIERYDLHADVAHAGDAMVDEASLVLYRAIRDAADTDAAKFVLRYSPGGRRRGWGSGQYIMTEGYERVLELAGELGLEPAELFNQMIVKLDEYKRSQERMSLDAEVWEADADEEAADAG
jgi:AraC-like DNA-binding protein